MRIFGQFLLSISMIAMIISKSSLAANNVNKRMPAGRITFNSLLSVSPKCAQQCYTAAFAQTSCQYLEYCECSTNLSKTPGACMLGLACNATDYQAALSASASHCSSATSTEYTAPSTTLNTTVVTVTRPRSTLTVQISLVASTTAARITKELPAAPKIPAVTAAPSSPPVAVSPSTNPSIRTIAVITIAVAALVAFSIGFTCGFYLFRRFATPIVFVNAAKEEI